jgi:phosphoglycolate phosphatase-like HAD superfamily hydrolase
VTPARLVLFDIDGTLMQSGGAGGRALARALREVFGIADPLSGVRLAGQTDPQIVLDAVARAGIPVPEDGRDLDRVQELYLGYLSVEMPASAGARLLPGVLDLLEALARTDSVRLGLVTGNIERGARIKLARFDLNRFFPVGAYGSDSRVRRDLVGIALHRARSHFALDLAIDRTVVVGDTDRDIDCGRHAGARTVAVATGGIPATALHGAGADVVLDDFGNTAAAVAAITGI